MEDIKNYYYSNRDAFSDKGARITYLCSLFGLPDEMLLKWLKPSYDEPVPDVLVIGKDLMFIDFALSLKSSIFLIVSIWPVRCLNIFSQNSKGSSFKGLC